MRRWVIYLLIAFVAFIVNFPMMHSIYLDRQLDQRGVEVVADVTDTRQVGDEFLLVFTVPAGGDRPEFEGAVAEVDEATYDDAGSSKHLTVTVLPEDGGVFEAQGQVPNRIGLIVTLIADLFLVAILGLVWRFGKVLRVELVLRATENLERCPPGARLDRIEGQRYLVSGDVAEILDDEIVLDLGDRRVRVVLDGYANPAGYEQSVRAIGYMIA